MELVLFGLKRFLNDGAPEPEVMGILCSFSLQHDSLFTQDMESFTGENFPPNEFLGEDVELLEVRKILGKKARCTSTAACVPHTINKPSRRCSHNESWLYMKLFLRQL